MPDGRRGGTDGGVYLVVFRLDRPCTIRVGRLGRFRFEAGLYAYAGSAQRGLAKRIARHRRRRAKALHWHVDYLARRAAVEAVHTWPLPKRAECLLAAALAADGSARRVVPGFGASDCRCEGHLVRLDGRLDPARLGRAVATTIDLSVGGDGKT